ncbi:hypothetical protein [Pendulispora albinea]|uniref:Uncharacterized protein n=1 Tax=Pendulispora albinea TaxID=2741071 RepID=A0ABZ2LS18_9BACT
MQNALKLTVEVGEDHVVKLPDEVPVGPVEIIVLMGVPAESGRGLEDFDPIELRKPIRLSDLIIEDRE